MTIEKYLSHFKNSQHICLVGPFYEHVHEHVHEHAHVHEHTSGNVSGDVQVIEEPVIFVDSGARLRQSGEGISVGDGDSFAGTMDVPLNPNKGFSDLAFVLQHIPQTFRDVTLLGFLGGRRDHELFNIGESHHFLCTRKYPTTLKFDNDIVGYSSGQWQFDRVGGFSVAVVEQTRVGITGDCLYPCPQTTLFKPLCSLGLSNVGTGTVWINCDRPVFILFEEVC